MNKSFRLAMGLTATSMLVVIAGCASMSEEECITADWRTIGVEDGAKGRGSSAIGNHREACAKYGVTPDLEAYETGRKQGLVQFCRPSRGYEHGRRGRTYAGVCPSDVEPAFLAAYNDGRAYYELELAVQEAETEIDTLESQLKRTKKELDKGQSRLSNSELTSEERSRIQRNNEELIESIVELETEKSQLLIELGQAQARFEAYEPGSY